MPEEKKIRAAVMGATGYAGAELVRILCGHPGVELALLTSRQHAGAPFSRVYPAFAGICDMVCEAVDPEKAAAAADVVFTALPHKLPMEVVPALLEAGAKVVDLSADFRFQSAGAYESAYQPHSAKHLLSRAVYGLPELFGDKIAAADLVGNPGCYPTSVILPLAPFLARDLLGLDSVIIDSKSGVSGAGRGLSLGTLFCEVSDAFRAYKPASHRHQPEMEEVLSTVAKKPVSITFVPHLAPMNRGMLSTIYAKMQKPLADEEARQILADFYQDKPYVRVLPKGFLPRTSDVRNSNFCDISLAVDKPAGRLILFSAIDNLVKGAAGQAVQNMNLMSGLPETQGLTMLPGGV
ncbi:MAG: N-acetyl-gamma-glutamyl-phosphate reductase [Deltaproteobacteria bacterium]|nr:N-acetyl-gamma-glutamyl-phosphate reductase [Deltaproteobacteria bacterium]